MYPKGLLKEYSRALSLLMRLMDMLTVFVAALVAYLIRFGDCQLPPIYLYALVIAILVVPIVFSSLNLYTSQRGVGFIKHIMILMQAVFIMGFVLAGMAFLTKLGGDFSRTWFMLWIVLSLCLLIFCRLSVLLFLRFMRTHGLNERRVAIIGAGELGVKVAASVQQALWTGFQIAMFLDDDAANKPQVIAGVPVQATPENLGEFLSEQGVDEIWLTLPLRAEARVKKILYELRHHTINTRFVLDIFGLDLLNHSITDLAGLPVINMRSTPMTGVNRMLKAIEDRVIAMLILLLIGPVLLLIAIGVKLTSKGPILFKQQRLGWDGRVIKVYKFRTMVVHQEAQGIITQATAHDQRITRFGKWLRCTSLDELPQFINVLQGRMSIVGPRPHALAHNELYKDAVPIYMQRHRVKPGITGWAQVNGWRGETDTLRKMQKRVEYDLYYINNWSLAFDLKIILLTILRGFVGPNAY